jgi:hypothetical protein
MKKLATFKGLLITSGLMGLAPSMAIGHAQGGMNIADYSQNQASEPLQSHAYNLWLYSPDQLGGGRQGLNCNAASTNPYDPRYNPSLLGGAWHDY